MQVHLLKKTDYSSKITEIENKIPSISGLAINSALAAVENKIPDVNGLLTLFYPFSIEVNKCSGSCNGINNQYGIRKL